ncbi:MAG: NAD(+)/NADH kinase [Eubacteriales bacterium]|nr:NAD(+)/NADH kinase [Eubacteriales bacterium]
MKHYIIITNRPKDPELSVTGRVRAFLEKNGASCSVYADELETEHWRQILKREGEQTDGILVLGGDGTLLRAARDTADSAIPLLGVNLGTLGFLAEVETAGIEQALERLLRGDYQVEERMMLAGQVVRQGRVREEACSLNDITITRCGHLRMLYFQILVNGRLLKEYHADGIIVATPTGSTGYNMSAGGPIVEPGARLIVLTPVCPHTLQTRSVILSAEDEIVIRITGKEDREETGIEACFDGGRNLELAPGDEVRVTRSDRATSIIKLGEDSFLNVLHRKMSE